MFIGIEHKFTDDVHMFKGEEHKFTGYKYKIEVRYGKFCITGTT